MDTASFLRLIWPEGSIYFITTIGANGAQNIAAADPDEGAHKIAQQDKNPSQNVYYSMASYKQENYKDSKGKMRQRTQENVAHLKCFWMDMDCKGRGNDYATQIDAARDILRLCDETGLPKASLVVNSGNGIHAYWVLDEAITEPEWKKIAVRWRATLDAHNIKHDSSCTTDSARILRPIGTHNRRGGKTKDVTLAGGTQQTMSLESFTSCLEDTAIDDTNYLSDAPTYMRGNTTLNEAADIVYPPSYTESILVGCALMRELKEKQGRVQEPLWRTTLGVLKFTEEAETVIHTFSNGYTGYSKEATIAKAAAWDTGPATCESLRRNSIGQCSDHCTTCPSKNAITTPVQLGRKQIVHEVVETTDAVTGFTTTKIEPVLSKLPTNFFWKDGRLQHRAIDKEATKKSGKDEYEDIPFCSQNFEATGYYNDERGKHNILWSLVLHDGSKKEFMLTGGSVGSGSAALMKELGENGITSLHGGAKIHMDAYITAWANKLRDDKGAVETRMHFGWQDDGSFVLGDTLYRPGEKEEKTRLGSMADSFVKYFEPKGDLETWKQLIDTAYNHDNSEPYQFILGAGFGSVLMKMMGVSGGTTISAVSYNTGQGKTTAMRNAFGIFGCADEGTPVTLARSSVTHKAIFTIAGILHSLPILVDEMTNIDGMELSDIVYTMSQGQSRVRLMSAGELAPQGCGWSSIMLSSSNKPMANIIAGVKPGADAELARFIEFNCSKAHKLPKVQADEIFSDLRNHYGHAGILFVKYVVNNPDKVAASIKTMRTNLDEALGLSGADRFWSAGYTAALVGLHIAQRLGLIKFNLGALRTWVDSQIVEMRKEISNVVSTSADCFGQMLTDLSPGIIVTDVEGGRGTAHKEAYVIKEPRTPYTGRAILDTSLAYISQTAVNEWCAKRHVDVNEVIREGVANGWVLNNGVMDRRYPSKGTNYAMGQIRCYVIDWAQLTNSAGLSHQLAELVQLCNKAVVK